MGENGNSGILQLILAGYFASQQARSERHRMSLESEGRIRTEREITERERIHSETEIFREKFRTEQLQQQCQARIEICREQRKAFESLCETVRESLHSGALTLENIRQQFGGLVQVMLENRVDPVERRMITGFLKELLNQQSTLSNNNQRLLVDINQEKPPGGLLS